MKTFDINYAAPASGRARTIIAAPIAHVWSVLTDFEHWPDWNPDISYLAFDRELTEGARFSWNLGHVTVRARLEVLDPPFVIGWSGRAPLIRARHVWSLFRHGAGTQVATTESFDGPFARLMPGVANRVIDRSLGNALALFKDECERTWRPDAPGPGPTRLAA